MTTFILFLIAFVALSTIGLWGKYIVAGIIVSWYLLIALLGVGFIAFIVSSIVQNAGKPIPPVYTNLAGPRSPAEEHAVEGK